MIHDHNNNSGTDDNDGRGIAWDIEGVCMQGGKVVVPKAAQPHRVWGHAPPENSEI